MQIPPPLFWQRYGNLHTFPRPTAKPTVAKINSILFPHPPRSSTATSAVAPRASAAFCSAAAFEFSSLAGVIVKFTTPSFRCAVVMVGRKPRTLRCSVWRGQRSLKLLHNVKTNTVLCTQSTWKAQISNYSRFPSLVRPIKQVLFTFHLSQKQHVVNRKYLTYLKRFYYQFGVQQKSLNERSHRIYHWQVSIFLPPFSEVIYQLKLFSVNRHRFLPRSDVQTYLVIFQA